MSRDSAANTLQCNVQAKHVPPAPVGALTLLSVTCTGVLFVILVVFAVSENVVPDEAGEDAGPAAGAIDGAWVVRLGAAAAVVASKLTNSSTNAIGAAEVYSGLYEAHDLQPNCALAGAASEVGKHHSRLKMSAGSRTQCKKMLCSA